MTECVVLRKHDQFRLIGSIVNFFDWLRKIILRFLLFIALLSSEQWFDTSYFRLVFAEKNSFFPINFYGDECETIEELIGDQQLGVSLILCFQLDGLAHIGFKWKFTT